jgi:hypothetical protein
MQAAKATLKKLSVFDNDAFDHIACILAFIGSHFHGLVELTAFNKFLKVGFKLV